LDAFGVVVSPRHPGGDLFVNFLHATNAATQTLLRQHNIIEMNFNIFNKLCELCVSKIFPPSSPSFSSGTPGYKTSHFIQITSFCMF